MPRSAPGDHPDEAGPQATARPALRGPRSLRLTFAYDDGGLRLVGRTARRSPPPPTEPVHAEPPPSAIVLELRSPDGEVRYRGVLIDPIPQSLEAGTPDGDRMRFTRAPASGAFTAVI